MLGVYNASVLASPEWIRINELCCVLYFSFNIPHIITALDLKREGLPIQRV
jgi:hypothetical protein